MSERSTVDVLDDGPYIIDGLEELKNSKDESLNIHGKVVLCRCGASSNKPYCDGTHKKIGFTNKVDKGESSPHSSDGESNICVTHNGPLEVSCALGLRVKD